MNRPCEDKGPKFSVLLDSMHEDSDIKASKTVFSINLASEQSNEELVKSNLSSSIVKRPSEEKVTRLSILSLLKYDYGKLVRLKSDSVKEEIDNIEIEIALILREGQTFDFVKEMIALKLTDIFSARVN